MTTKIQALLRDFEGTAVKDINSCSSKKELEVVILSLKRKYKEAGSLLFSSEKRYFDEVFSNLYRFAEVKQKSLIDNERFETVKKILFE